MRKQGSLPFSFRRHGNPSKYASSDLIVLLVLESMYKNVLVLCPWPQDLHLLRLHVLSGIAGDHRLFPP